ncbi:MAG: nitroreductase/quinone reductase family protein [Miltoncostaeaceae bacterium]
MITTGRGPGIRARALNGTLMLAVDRLGLPLPALRVLRVHGRRTGSLHRVPLLVLRMRDTGRRYLVAPRGRTDWARNLDSAGWGEIGRGRRLHRVRAIAVTGAEREEAIAAYLRRFGWLNRKVFGVERRPSATRIAELAPHHAVFRLEPYE